MKSCLENKLTSLNAGICQRSIREEFYISTEQEKHAERRSENVFFFFAQLLGFCRSLHTNCNLREIFAMCFNVWCPSWCNLGIRVTRPPLWPRMILEKFLLQQINWIKSTSQNRYFKNLCVSWGLLWPDCHPDWCRETRGRDRCERLLLDAPPRQRAAPIQHSGYQWEVLPRHGFSDCVTFIYCLRLDNCGKVNYFLEQHAFL